MDAKTQATELINEFYYALPNNGYACVGTNNVNARWEEAIKCALICVNNMLEVLCVYEDISKDYQFWKEVKQEIEKRKRD